ncbi:MAG: hypothetical protein ABI268_06310 [Rhodanobacter sp.]
MKANRRDGSLKVGIGPSQLARPLSGLQCPPTGVNGIHSAGCRLPLPATVRITRISTEQEDDPKEPSALFDAAVPLKLLVVARTVLMVPARQEQGRYHAML